MRSCASAFVDRLRRSRIEPKGSHPFPFQTKKWPRWGHCLSGGEGGIRTPGTVSPYTRFPGEHLKPLSHLSESFSVEQSRRDSTLRCRCSASTLTAGVLPAALRAASRSKIAPGDFVNHSATSPNLFLLSNRGAILRFVAGAQEAPSHLFSQMRGAILRLKPRMGEFLLLSHCCRLLHPLPAGIVAGYPGRENRVREVLQAQL